uniref:Uncharacterized protein n=1 Tax=viral metagenome TaxID=1070528 RepID=A0A6M3J0R2_9ZZZZ
MKPRIKLHRLFAGGFLACATAEDGRRAWGKGDTIRAACEAALHRLSTLSREGAER